MSSRREALGLSQRRLALLADIPQQTVSRVELDRVVPRYPTMRAIARTLGTTVEDLFPMDSYPPSLREPRKVTKRRAS